MDLDEIDEALGELDIDEDEWDALKEEKPELQKVEDRIMKRLEEVEDDAELAQEGEDAEQDKPEGKKGPKKGEDVEDVDEDDLEEIWDAVAGEDGEIDREEGIKAVRKMSKKMGWELSEEDIEAVVDEVGEMADTDRSGKVSKEEAKALLETAVEDISA